MNSRAVIGLSCLLGFAVGAAGCVNGDGDPPPSPAQSEQPKPSPEPRAPKAPAVLHGLQLPAGFRITGRFNETTHLVTHLSVADATGYFKEQLLAQHVEVEPRRTVFPRAHLKADPDRRLLRVELKRERGGTVVRVRDITPAPMAQGLSPAQRWEQAGRNPDGSLANPSQVF